MSPALQSLRQWEGAMGGETQVGLPGVVAVHQTPVLSSLQRHSLGEKSRIASLVSQEVSSPCRSEDRAPKAEGKECVQSLVLGAGFGTRVTHCEVKHKRHTAVTFPISICFCQYSH